MRAPALTTLPSVIDPTMNVNALVAALEEKTKELAAAESKYQNDMRLAETRRVDQLAEQKQLYDFKIADLLQKSNDQALQLLAVSQKESNALSAGQITDLQQKSWTTQGETQKGGDSWRSLTTILSLLIAAGALAFAVLSRG